VVIETASTTGGRRAYQIMGRASRLPSDRSFPALQRARRWARLRRPRSSSSRRLVDAQGGVVAASFRKARNDFEISFPPASGSEDETALGVAAA